MNSRQAGFTLIEMLGVLAIMALLSAAVSVTLGGARHAADLQAGIEQIEQADVSGRELARSSDQLVSFSISLESGSMTRSQGALTTFLGRLPADVSIDRIRRGDHVIGFGSFDVPMNTRGCTESFAIHLAGADGEKQWIVFAGMTGQMLKVSDEDIDPIMQQTSRPAGPDTD